MLLMIEPFFCLILSVLSFLTSPLVFSETLSPTFHEISSILLPLSPTKDTKVTFSEEGTDNVSYTVPTVKNQEMDHRFLLWMSQFSDKNRWQLRTQKEATEMTSYHKQSTSTNREVIVHLFEWRWLDIAKECEEYLGPMGFAGVQISPPNEHSILWEPSWNVNVVRPWYERYRPVSYILKTRSGDANQFEEMVRRCNVAGIRIYVDLVINHMCNHLDKMVSTAGSEFDASVPEYLAVPYFEQHFNSKTKCGSRSGDIENEADVLQLRNCRLLGLNDLDQSKAHVREKIAEYLNMLIDFGVGGFRVDAAKHMWPDDLEAIYKSLKNLNTSFFPPATRPFIYQEVTDLGLDPIAAAEYTHLGRVTEFKYGIDLSQNVLGNDGTNLTALRSLGEGEGFLTNQNALVFVDNHDTQRGHGAGEFNRILSFRDGKNYVMAVAFMLAWPYGVPSLMSSYNWPRRMVRKEDENNWVGPPHDDDFNILPVDINSDGSCLNGWVCEHRWAPIRRMVAFRNAVSQSNVVHWWDNGNNQIAFGRAAKGFIVFNHEGETLDASFQTGLLAGTYCDVFSGQVTNGVCSGYAVVVNGQGEAHVRISRDKDTPAVALHIGEMIPVGN